MKTAVPIIILVGLALTACSRGQPDINLPEPQVDIGLVVNGEIRNFETIIQNNGQGDLIIEAVTTSCGCTSAEVVPSVIPAGERGTLTIRFDSGAHGPDEVGSVTRQVFIATNDPDQSEIVFSFTAEILPASP
jgi:hypothetical protein